MRKYCIVCGEEIYRGGKTGPIGHKVKRSKKVT